MDFDQKKGIIYFDSGITLGGKGFQAKTLRLAKRGMEGYEKICIMCATVFNGCRMLDIAKRSGI